MVGYPNSLVLWDIAYNYEGRTKSFRPKVFGDKTIFCAQKLISSLTR